MDDEIKDFLEKEVDNCDKEIKETKKTIDAALDVRQYYQRRKDFLVKLQNFTN